MDIRKLKGLSPREVVSAAVRKFIYRYDEMGYYVGDKATLVKVTSPGYETSLVPGPQITLDDLANPNVDEESIAELHSNRGSICVLVRRDDRVVASNWYLTGNVFVPELRRPLLLEEGTYYSCRTYVDPEHRGQRLMAHMMTALADGTPDFEQFAGLIFDWNKASIRGVANNGWRRTKTVWSRTVLGWHTSGERVDAAA